MYQQKSEADKENAYLDIDIHRITLNLRPFHPKALQVLFIFVKRVTSCKQVNDVTETKPLRTINKR